MEQDRTRSEWAGCSNFKERYEELRKAHEEFQRLLDNGFEIKDVKVRRPRIQKSKTPKAVLVSILGGKVKMTFEEYQKRGQGFRVIMKIF
jgi:hypothetical protein